MFSSFISDKISFFVIDTFPISYKEMGAPLQTLTSSTVTERLGSSIAEPSLTTRDALDKYQLVAQKVVNRSCSF